MSATDSIASATIAGADQFTTGKRFGGPFVLRLPASTGSNTCRLQCSVDGSTWITATDKDGVAYGFTAAGTYVIDNPCATMYWRAGSPAADYASSSYVVQLVP